MHEKQKKRKKAEEQRSLQVEVAFPQATKPTNQPRQPRRLSAGKQRRVKLHPIVSLLLLQLKTNEKPCPPPSMAWTSTKYKIPNTICFIFLVLDFASPWTEFAWAIRVHDEARRWTLSQFLWMSSFPIECRRSFLLIFGRSLFEGVASSFRSLVHLLVKACWVFFLVFLSKVCCSKAPSVGSVEVRVSSDEIPPHRGPIPFPSLYFIVIMMARILMILNMKRAHCFLVLLVSS